MTDARFRGLVLDELYAAVATAEIEVDGTIRVRSAGERRPA